MLRHANLILLVLLWICGGEPGLAQQTSPQTPTADRQNRAYREFAMVHQGDVTRGKELFSDAQKTACAQCHTVDGSGGRAGPDLFAIGDKFPRPDLIRAILEPSADIAIGYESTLVETKSGEAFEGVIKQATDSWIELMGANGQSARIATQDIETRQTNSRSLMPEGLEATMSLQEFTDLIEYLASLRQPAAALASAHGMPETIARLDKPIAVRPFISEAHRFPHSTVQDPGGIRSGLVWFGQIPGIPKSFLAVHESGKIWRIDKNADGDVKTLFADLSGEVYSARGPNGLLGLAFHPKFRENLKYYLKHQVMENGRLSTVVIERRAAPDLKRDSGMPSRRLLKIDSTTVNHSGGCIEFGPDGFLYVGMGDTGPQRDPQGHGQNLNLLLGKILRIDVNREQAGLPYGIPVDNPFRENSEARPEIWAYGFREPWRLSFDPATGDLWAGDVGQDRVEEVTIVRRGENHGWNVYEGFEPFSNRYRREGEVYVPPVFAYRRKYGNSITGGYVYRANKQSSFYGVYICGDYTSRRIWGLTQENRVLKKVFQIGTSPESIASFGIDESGEIYLVGYEGMIYKLDFSDAVFAEPAAMTSSVKATASDAP